MTSSCTGSHHLVFDPDSLGWDVGHRSPSCRAAATTCLFDLDISRRDAGRRTSSRIGGSHHVLFDLDSSGVGRGIQTMVLQTGNGSHHLLFDPDSLGWDVGHSSLSGRAAAIAPRTRPSKPTDLLQRRSRGGAQYPPRFPRPQCHQPLPIPPPPCYPYLDNPRKAARPMPHNPLLPATLRLRAPRRPQCRPVA